MTPLRKWMTEELQLRNYADFTIERYLDAVRSFAKFVGKSRRIRRARTRFANISCSW